MKWTSRTLTTYLRNRFDHRQSHQDIHDFVARATAAGVLQLGVGQNHSILHPILHAIGKARPVDPESDLREYLKFNLSVEHAKRMVRIPRH
ncbi:hypothetical protein BUPH_08406 (plasmid) [Paraburkholderia phenoliruptrix BR3459a]|uniref:Uncharacterized protein n=1 Tax=Paraburkholderia phenoliruptrix BR3459a TaxID=1229205 RepID=K0DZW0_9BURK|nr:hypothetical protein BUPH_08406 [Paraburkholderia phenoliruptrix BR3459a]